MMPRIIFLLLIASSPFLTLGDETESWGKLSSGPSESECRPYIEKALQEASVPDSPSQPGVGDDAGGTVSEESTDAQSEASESSPSEIPSDSKETLEEQESDGQLINDESAENESLEDPSETVVPEGETDTSNEINSLISEASGEQSTENTTEFHDNENDSATVNDEESNTSQEDINETGEQEQHVQENEDSQGEQTEEELENVRSIEEESQEIQGTGDIETPDEDSDLPSDSPEEASDNQNEGSGEQSVESPDDTTDSREEHVAEEITPEEEEASEEPDEARQNAESSENETTSNEENVSQGNIDETVSTESQEITEKTESTEEAINDEESIDISEKQVNQSEEATEESTEVGTDVEGGEIKEEQEPTEESTEVGTDSEGEEIKEELEAINQDENKNISAEESDGPADSKSDETGEADAEVPSIVEDASSETQSQESTDEHQIPSTSNATDESDTSQKTAPGATDSEESSQTDALESEEEPGVSSPEEEPAVPSPEEELSVDIEIPENLRSREHMSEILHFNSENDEIEKLLNKIVENTLRDLKKLYDIAIKPLEILYKYRDLSNRHFGDPEIFSKPLILFMGPWSGGKSTIINYLLENEYKKTALRTGAEPSPAYFNIVMWGESEEVLDGTQLAADWTFSGLQKFGQGLLDRLRGLKLNHPLLEKVNIVEIPGILEIRKQVERLFPFNDACQWFIDRADIIFLVYDPSKLDVGPETEAILDQLKGREMQTRIVLNKADQVKPEELMRVQGTLIWNISPLMSSTEPPVMYTTSLWSLPYETGAPARLLFAQERAFLKDLRDAIEKRVENKIASARRFAVRVRNHAKMVDCYLTTYYNHKSFFGNKKKISDEIIEHPQNYHIYEGLSTLTNISRYDLPDPDVYRDFFRLNPVYEFQQLSSTCTYFRGCPINRLDVAIAYDLPELVGKYKKSVEQALSSVKK